MVEVVEPVAYRAPPLFPVIVQFMILHLLPCDILIALPTELPMSVQLAMIGSPLPKQEIAPPASDIFPKSVQFAIVGSPLSINMPA